MAEVPVAAAAGAVALLPAAQDPPLDPTPVAATTVEELLLRTDPVGARLLVLHPSSLESVLWQSSPASGSTAHMPTPTPATITTTTTPPTRTRAARWSAFAVATRSADVMRRTRLIISRMLPTTNLLLVRAFMSQTFHLHFKHLLTDLYEYRRGGRGRPAEARYQRHSTQRHLDHKRWHELRAESR